MNVNRINYYNILGMLAAACLAIVIPFELVLISYATLGPLHYFTEISWLNGKRYFTLKKYDPLFIAGVVVISVLLKLPYPYVIYYAFGLSFILLVIPGAIMRVIVFTVIVALGYFLLTNNILRTIFGLYLPTLIHVYVFTGSFLLLGALKNKDFSGYLAFFTFLICPVLLCVLFTGLHNAPAQWAMHNYGHFANLNTTTLRSKTIDLYNNKTSIILTRFIAFAYTYHYINWFAKTSVINWHRITITRATIIGILWLASVGLYFYNYNLGIRWLYILSLAHVILEFPLNQRSFMGIGRELRGRFTA
ncbi:hypothetical protein [Mucilaginibacter ginsenosidivorax]|uniref:Uncharacterized protein n=1 Tax=Mucilaginibacter ginsenosidivorax TaxID=862126 RepID=A0A5B8VUQ9_9SPHI|nr:hypothetical protein [Mucilaginibacter ginsenosidivorax]QEC75317.1 hypothetical protein FSB76_04940 [Mucilaginibacter ginsenosidivorax]